MWSAQIFISYRRDDSAAVVGRLRDHLGHEFGADFVFRDIDTIPPGADFARYIASRIHDCDVLLAVIGKQWLAAAGTGGQRRLDEPLDFVRGEIREALTQGKLVIPVLVEGASLPSRAQLPADIAALADRHAAELDDRHFDQDFERLAGAIRSASTADDGRKPPLLGWLGRAVGDHRLRRGAGLGLGTLLLAAALWSLQGLWGRTPAAPLVIVVDAASAASGLKAAEQTLVQALQAGGTSAAQTAQWRAQLAQVRLQMQAPQAYAETRSAALTEAGRVLNSLPDASAPQARAQAVQFLARNDTAPAEAVLGELAAGPQVAAPQAAQAAFALGELARSAIDYAKAFDQYARAVQLQPGNALYQNMAGLMAHALGDEVRAATYLNQALKLRTETLSTDDPLLAESYSNLALVAKAQGQFAQAEQWSLEALRIHRAAARPDERAIARSQNNLAVLYKRQGRTAEAEVLFKDALARTRQSTGADSADVATALNNLAALYSSQQRPAEARTLYEQALAIRQKVLPKGHPDIAGSLVNLAELTAAQGLYERAEPLYQQALAIQTQALPADHPALATTLNNLAELYRAQGLYAKAEPLYLKALALLKRAFGPSQPEVLQAQHNLALVYLDQGQFADAEPLLAAALQGLLQRLPPGDPNLARVMNNYALCLDRLGRGQEAAQWRQRAAAIEPQRPPGAVAVVSARAAP